MEPGDNAILETSWDERAARAVDRGGDHLRQFLKSGVDVPTRKEQYSLLLERTFRHHQTLDDQRYKEIFAKLRLEAHATKPERGHDTNDFIRDLRQARRGRVCISFYDVFRSSIERNRAGLNPKLEYPAVAKLILDEGKNELHEGGAIHACAEFGQKKLLDHVLAALRLEIPRYEERMKVVFRSGPDSEFTPLGVAIREQHVDCITALMTVKGASQYIDLGRNVLTDGSSGLYMLHEILNWTRQNAAFERDDAAKADVAQRQVPILNQIVNTYSHLLAQHDLQGHPPYKVALDLRSSFGTKAIEVLLRNSIFELLHDPEDVKRALYSKTDIDKEIGLDLSDFNYDSHHFKEFVDDFEFFDQEELGQKWTFEDTLLYLTLPQLPKGSPTSAVERFLKWLKTKSVKTILKLKLPDSWALYSGQFVCEHILQQFRVHQLDWARLELDVNELAEISTRGECIPLTKLHLYSHGAFRSGMQENISAQTTVRTALWLNRIEDVYLKKVGTPPPPSPNPRQADPIGLAEGTPPPTRAHLPENERESPEARLRSPFKGFDEFLDGGTISWDAFTSKPRVTDAHLEVCGSQLNDGLVKCHQFLAALRKFSKFSDLHTELKPCVDAFEHQQVKIAILDNGVDQMRFPIYQNIERGVSFVRAGGSTEMPLLPWYTAADAHGTQMAYLARSMNPWCRIFPARIGVLQRDIDVEAAVKAIHWAIDREVDIISISWVVRKQHDDLEKAIDKAVNQHGILVFCSTADVGSSFYPNVYPATYKTVIAVSASNAHGMPRLESSHDVHIMLGGDQVEAHGPRYMKSHAEGYISGSSVATALAAGLASLCLLLARMANPNGDSKMFRDRIVMLAVLRLMQESEHDRIIAPSKLFNESFDLHEDFDSGKMAPPKGLELLHWSSVDARLRRNRVEPFDGTVPRRNLSKERHQKFVSAKD